MTTTLLFAVILGFAGALFVAWAFRQSLNPAIILGLGGFVLLAVATLTYVYALHTACHGDFDFVRNPFGCTR